MAIQIFNTLTRKKEDFKTIEPNKVSMYVCGPTVYNYIHIGNARPAIVFDTVRRYLEYKNYDVDYVLNFTDVDDKIIAEAKKQNKTVKELTNYYIDAYLKDIQKLDIKPATYLLGVTYIMYEIIECIKGLIEKEYAYLVDGDAYFKPRKFEDYGKLSAQSIEEVRAGTRIQSGEKKDDPLDFTIWKQAKPGE